MTCAAAAGVNVTDSGVGGRVSGSKVVEAGASPASDATCAEPSPRTTPAQQAAMLVEAVLTGPPAAGAAMRAFVRRVNAEATDGASEEYAHVVAALVSMVILSAGEAERHSRGGWSLRSYLWSVRMRGQALPKTGS